MGSDKIINLEMDHFLWDLSSYWKSERFRDLKKNYDELLFDEYRVDFQLFSEAINIDLISMDDETYIGEVLFHLKIWTV